MITSAATDRHALRRLSGFDRKTTPLSIKVTSHTTVFRCLVAGKKNEKGVQSQYDTDALFCQFIYVWYSYNGSIPVFQTGGAGSTPVYHSMRMIRFRR